MLLPTAVLIFGTSLLKMEVKPHDSFSRNFECSIVCLPWGFFCMSRSCAELLLAGSKSCKP